MILNLSFYGVSIPLTCKSSATVTIFLRYFKERQLSIFFIFRTIKIQKCDGDFRDSGKIKQDKFFWLILRESSGKFEFDACFGGQIGDIVGEVGNIGDRASH